MKRYLVFVGRTYYPGGGFEDFQGRFESIEEAEKLIYHMAEEAVKNEGYDNEEDFWDKNWAHIYDIVDETFVSKIGRN